MLVHELIELLQEADAGQEVRLACQPNWPLAFQISHTFDAADAEPVPCDGHDKIVCEECEHDGEVDLPDPIFWIVQGDHPDNPYFVPGEVWR